MINIRYCFPCCWPSYSLPVDDGIQRVVASAVQQKAASSQSPDPVLVQTLPASDSSLGSDQADDSSNKQKVEAEAPADEDENDFLLVSINPDTQLVSTSEMI